MYKHLRCNFCGTSFYLAVVNTATNYIPLSDDALEDFVASKDTELFLTHPEEEGIEVPLGNTFCENCFQARIAPGFNS